MGLLLGACAIPSEAQVRLTKDEALKLYFPGATIERKTLFLTDGQQGEIQRVAKARVESKIVTYYVARALGRLAGVAFLETQTVRTMPATIMVIVDPDTTVWIVEIMAFYEPTDYLPSERWLGQYRGRSSEDDLFLKRGIQNISGATLSAQTISDGVRRWLAVYIVAVAQEVNG